MKMHTLRNPFSNVLPLFHRVTQPHVAHTTRLGARHVLDELNQLMALAKSNYQGELKERIRWLLLHLADFHISHDFREDLEKTLHNTLDAMLYEKSNLDALEYAQYKFRTLKNRIEHIHLAKPGSKL